ncbi:DUF5692 family protein [Corynebacterium ulcerans]|uniref:DUF5692 family protein n=1 Tax=Corynebacterium ulcerans TaxID=65058 RepID=UPI0022B32BB9|nr:DUF5692 family protein [Corynebacterium ulcerans]
MLIIVTAALAITAWLAQRNKWVVLLVFIVAPLLLTLLWWPHSTEGTASSGWFCHRKAIFSLGRIPLPSSLAIYQKATTQLLVPHHPSGDLSYQHPGSSCSRFSGL